MNQKYLYSNIKKLLKKQGKTATLMSEDIGVSKNLLGQLNAEKANPTMGTLDGIADYLDTNVKFLLYGEDDFSLDTEERMLLDYFKSLPYLEKRELIRELVLREAASSKAGQEPPELLVSAGQNTAPGINKPKAPPGKPPKPKKQAQ